VLGLSAQAVLSLQGHRVRQDADRAAAGADYRSDLDLVFARPDGSPWGAKSAYDAFKVLLASLGLPGDVHLHGVRHSVATALLTGEDSIDIPTVGKLLGHTSPATTAGVYAHVLQKRQDEASRQLHRILHRRAAAQ
jgi:integrase